MVPATSATSTRLEGETQPSPRKPSLLASSASVYAWANVASLVACDVVFARVHHCQNVTVAGWIKKDGYNVTGEWKQPLQNNQGGESEAWKLKSYEVCKKV